MVQRKELREPSWFCNIPCVALAVQDVVALALWLSNLGETVNDDEIEEIDKKCPPDDPS